jgi:hypothetical protein
MAACILLVSVIALVFYDNLRRQSYVVLSGYPEHMVEKSAQYGFGYGKPGIGYGPTVWEEERRQGEKNRFPWPQSSDRWWVDHNDGPGLSNDGRAYPIPFIPHLRDDLAGGDAFDSDMTPAFAAQDHTGGGAPYLAWGAHAYTPWVRSITPTEAPEGEWHQRRWAKVLRALWDKKYYVEPYYASEPLHSPVLHMLHLKDYIPDMGGRTGDGRGEPPESQRLMASGNEDARGRARVETDGQELPESQRYWQEQRTQGNTEVYFGYPEMRQVRSRLPDDMKLAASRHLQRKAQQVAGADGARWEETPGTSLSLRTSLHPRSHVERSTIPDCLHAADASCLAATDALVHSSHVESSIIPDESSIIPDDPLRNMMREANGQPELQHLASTAAAATSATASSHTSTTTDTTDTSRSSSFFSKWGHGAQREVTASHLALTQALTLLLDTTWYPAIYLLE